MCKIIICGKAGSGKTFLKNFLVQERGFSGSVSATTRPRREGETEGVDYFFMYRDKFIEKICDDPHSVMEFQLFNGWFYATLQEEWNNKEVFIMTPSAIKGLVEKGEKDVCIVYLDIEEKVRKRRLKERKGSPDSVKRRLCADQKDFEPFDRKEIPCHVHVVNPEFDPSEILGFIELCRTSKNSVVFNSV